MMALALMIAIRSIARETRFSKVRDSSGGTDPVRSLWPSSKGCVSPTKFVGVWLSSEGCFFLSSGLVDLGALEMKPCSFIEWPKSNLGLVTVICSGLLRWSFSSSSSQFSVDPANC